MADYFVHLVQEEAVLIPALQKHYSDEQLRAVKNGVF